MKKFTQEELEKAFNEGKQAALKGGKRTMSNPHTNWELYTAWNNGWKEGSTPSDDGPAFRRIVRQPGTGDWLAYAGSVLRARFLFESDAIEWRANDPLNKGSIGELIDREIERKKDE